MDIVKIIPRMKEFHWGSTDYIPRLVGQPEHKAKIGELWMGVHPNAPAVVPALDNMLLKDFLSLHPHFLGKHEQLPFLFKVLSIEEPLSIQCHPTKEQAVAGWAAETEKRKTSKAELLNYQDDNAKAEMLCAITPVTALCGFRRWQEIEEDLCMLMPTQFERLFARCALQTNPIASFFHTLYRLPEHELHACIEQYRTSLEKLGDASRCEPYLSPEEIAMNCIRAYPEDPGVFAPYFLNVIHLAPNDAIYLEPRVVHAYVRGNGIELMNNSDNVLRAGLTTKHMDIDELEAVMIAEAQPISLLHPAIDYGYLHFMTDSPEFALTVYDHTTHTVDHGDIAIMLCTEGETEITSGSEHFVLSRGECCLIGASVKTYHVAARGKAYCASTKDNG
ncbi:MAG: mannose-6-phosphate isomerase, class I [Sphaerochaetaceae bacterium]